VKAENAGSGEQRKHANGMTHEKMRAAIDAIRRRDGLPVSTVDRLLEDRGVPPRLWGHAQNPKETEAVIAVRRLLAGEGVLLVLSGIPGCGKSSGAAFALAGNSGIWVHAPDLARPPLDGDSGDDRMRSCGLQVRDDVGTEHSPSGYAGSRICGVLEHRESHMRPSILTTNLTGEEFVARYGDRMKSRLNGDPLGFVHVAGLDLRVNPPHWQDEAEHGPTRRAAG
jgi:hypothetical protein